METLLEVHRVEDEYTNIHIRLLAKTLFEMYVAVLATKEERLFNFHRSVVYFLAEA